MEDKPYAFSRQCTWHGELAEASPRRVMREGEPDHECPRCGSPVLVHPSGAAWWASIRATNKAIPEYEEMMRWSENKCFPDFETMQNAYRQYMEGLR